MLGYWRSVLLDKRLKRMSADQRPGLRRPPPCHAEPLARRRAARPWLTAREARVGRDGAADVVGSERRGHSTLRKVQGAGVAETGCALAADAVARRRRTRARAKDQRYWCHDARRKEGGGRAGRE